MTFFFEKTDLLGNEIPDSSLSYLRAIASGLSYAFDMLGIKLNDSVTITNNPYADNPMYSPSHRNRYNTDLIILTCKSYSYWCQVIYQLSHELTHFAIDKMSQSRSTLVKWIEETICEAVSLYMLKWFYINWSSTILFQINPDYASSINQYLNIEMQNTGTNHFSEVRSYENLLHIDENSETHREYRINERNQLFLLINKDTFMALMDYRRFIVEGTILLDGTEYCNKYSNNPAVQFLCSLQQLSKNN